MNEQYLTILQESLQKKLEILDEIQRLCEMQNAILSEESVDYEKFDVCVDDKDICIEQLSRLDDGFEQLYNKVSAELQENKDKYRDWIAKTKELISQITEKSVAIQAQETRNKQSIESAFRAERKGIGQSKKTVRAAMDYYRNMSKTSVVTSQYLDKRK